MKIDSHQHFWRFNKEDFTWMNDQMHSIKKDQLPENLTSELRAIGFDGSVAVQARQSLEETNWLLELAGRNDFIKGVVGWIDLRSPDVEKQLEYYSNHSKLVGVRHVVHDEPNDDFILQSDFIRGIRLLQKFNLTYDLLIFPKHLPNTIKVVEQFPKLTFILDHIAKPLIKDSVISPWKEDIERLAQYPNVFCKVSGMVTEAKWNQWKLHDFTPYLDVVFNAFGCNRIMIGSDWPVCKVTGSYQRVMNIVLSYIENFSDTDKAMVLGGTACKAYGIEGNRIKKIKINVV